jgi:hypothetical protein
MDDDCPNLSCGLYHQQGNIFPVPSSPREDTGSHLAGGIANMAYVPDVHGQSRIAYARNA